MTQSLKVNQKEYLPSAELGKKFNYTSDYISKLARDEKVLGTRVGRQWFVEPESLKTYIQQLEVEKQIAKENLSRQRKIEHQQHAGQSGAVVSRAEEGHSWVTAGQALAVVLCGALLGVMSLSAYTSRLAWSDMWDGTRLVAQQISAPVANGLSDLFAMHLSEREAVANPLLGTEGSNKLHAGSVGPQFSAKGQYTNFPQAIRSDDIAVTDDRDDVEQRGEGYLLPFSDDVVVEEEDQVLRVRPVFRDSTGELYQLSAIPVVADNE